MSNNNTLALVGIGAAALFIFKDQISQSFTGVSTGVQGIGSGVSEAFTGVGSGISDLTGSVVRGSDKLIDRSTEIYRNVSTPTEIIRDTSNLITSKLRNEEQRSNTQADERLKSQDEVGSIQGSTDIVIEQGNLNRTKILDQAKTTSTNVITQLPNAFLRGVEVVKNTLTGSNDNNFNQNQAKITTKLVSTPVTSQDKLKTTTDKLKNTVTRAASSVSSFFKKLF